MVPMTIENYINQINHAIQQYESATFVISATLHTQLRSAKQGYIKGHIVFLDHSTLHFTMYLLTRGVNIVKKRYSFHYQDEKNNLIFRYDNANHKPSLGFAEHKHIGDNHIIEAKAPELSDVLLEIAIFNDWSVN